MRFEKIEVFTSAMMQICSHLVPAAGCVLSELDRLRVKARCRSGRILAVSVGGSNRRLTLDVVLLKKEPFSLAVLFCEHFPFAHDSETASSTLSSRTSSSSWPATSD